MLSKSGIHAVRALILLAELPEGAYAGAVSIAEKIEAPRNYLGKILQQLSRHGLLESQKGLGGGFRLARPAHEIALLDVVSPIEQIHRWSGCILGRATCSEENPCAIHDHWKEVKEAYLKLLTDTTIADLVDRQKAVGQ
jgi:Rrf2 family iron-sulfur cluster assembly transcriptional regulator